MHLKSRESMHDKDRLRMIRDIVEMITQLEILQDKKIKKLLVMRLEDSVPKQKSKKRSFEETQYDHESTSSGEQNELPSSIKPDPEI